MLERHPPGGFRGIFAALCLLFSLAAGCSREVARVGEIPITERDLSLRAKVIEVYYPGGGERHAALSQLVEGYLSLELLKSLGMAPTGADLEREAARIEGNTKAPERLARIRAIYGEDRKAYLDTYVRVVYAERVLFNEAFPNSPDAQREPSAGIPRKSYGEWFWESASKVPVAIRDKALKEAFLKNVSWGNRVRLS